MSDTQLKSVGEMCEEIKNLREELEKALDEGQDLEIEKLQEENKKFRCEIAKGNVYLKSAYDHVEMCATDRDTAQEQNKILLDQRDSSYDEVKKLQEKNLFLKKKVKRLLTDEDYFETEALELEDEVPDNDPEEYGEYMANFSP